MVASLQTLCGIKVAVVISSLPDVKKQIFFSPKFPRKDFSKYSRWRFALIKSATRRLKNYPSRLVDIIPIYLIPLIGLQMLKWAKFLASNFGLTLKFCYDFIKYSIFTSRGTIDELKASRELMKETSLSPFLKYKIASYYFLEDVIPVLWGQLQHELNFKEMLRNHSPDGPVFMWSKYLEEKEAPNMTTSELNSLTDRFLMKAFLYGIDKENLVAIQYCWKTIKSSKIILNYDDKTIAQNEGKVHISIYDGDWLNKYETLNFDDVINFKTYERLLFRNLEVCGKILEFFVLRMNKEEIKNLLLHYKVSSSVLKCLLLWPYQYLFMDTADAILQNLSRDDFYDLLHSIVDIIEDSDLGKTFNYRQLFNKFWVKSPSYLHLHVIESESRCFRLSNNVKPLFCYKYKIRASFLLQKLIFLRTFSSDDELNLSLILKEATYQDKNDILHFQGKDICFELILSGKFGLADKYLGYLTLDVETLKTFKVNLASGVFFTVMTKENIDLADQFVNWAVSSNEIEDLKAKIFSEVFKVSSIAHWFMRFEISVSFLNNIFKWFLNSDYEIEKWKTNIIFDESFSGVFVIEYDEPPIFNQFLEWLGYDKEKVSDVKVQILHKALPDIVQQLFVVYKGVTAKIASVDIILYLCSNNTKKILQFIDSVHALCKDYVEQRKCVLCRDSEFVYFDEIASKFYCSSHYNEILSLEEIDLMCFPLKELGDIVARQEKEKT